MAATTLETTSENATPAAPQAGGFRLHRITAERYERMAELGVISSKEPIFLWEGRLVEKMTKNPPHEIATAELTAALIRLLPPGCGWFVRPEQSLVLGDDSVPEPDLAVARGVSRDYRKHAPLARDVALVVEVSDSSLAVDAGEVLEAYARESIPVYWLVNIPRNRIEVYTRPEGGRYAEQSVYGPDDEVPIVLDGREFGRVAVRDILP